jgi:hypothetical protein
MPSIVLWARYKDSVAGGKGLLLGKRRSDKMGKFRLSLNHREWQAQGGIYISIILFFFALRTSNL